MSAGEDSFCKFAYHWLFINQHGVNERLHVT